MLRRVRDLSPDEEAVTYLTLFKYSNPSFWQVRETEFARSIGAIAGAFDAQHRDVFDERWRDEEVANALYQLAVQNQQTVPFLYNAIIDRLNEVIN